MGGDRGRLCVLLIALVLCGARSAFSCEPSQELCGGILAKDLFQPGRLLPEDERGKGPDQRSAAPKSPVKKLDQNLPRSSVTSLFPHLSWLAAKPDDAKKLKIRTNKPFYHVGDSVVVTVTMLDECNLTVLAQGSGGAVDVLYPNRDQSGDFPLGAEISLPPVGGRFGLFIRANTSSVLVEERIVAVCLPADRKLINSVKTSPIKSLLQNSEEMRILEGLRHDRATMAVAVAPYLVEAGKEAAKNPRS